MIDQSTGKAKLFELMAAFPVIAIIGPRQAGKTALAREFEADHFFDLENPRDAALLEEPQLALESLSGVIVIDETQRGPQRLAHITTLRCNSVIPRLLGMTQVISKGSARMAAMGAEGENGFDELKNQRGRGSPVPPEECLCQ